MRNIQRWILAAIGFALTSCATPTPQPESMRDPTANFAAYHTYAWVETSGVDGQDAPLKLLDSNIRTAIAAEMKKRGYVESATSPDLRMTYETASADKVESSPIRVGVGMGSWGGNVGGSVGVGTPSVRNFREGTLVIHAIDHAKNAEVWQGKVSGKLTDGSLEPAAVQRAVSLAMKDFPARQTPAN